MVPLTFLCPPVNTEALPRLLSEACLVQLIFCSRQPPFRCVTFKSCLMNSLLSGAIDYPL